MRYKQSVLGILWAVLQPMAMMVVLELILTRFFHQPSHLVSRYAKLLPWMFFASAVIASTNRLVANADLLRKIYFPRIAVPIAAVGAPLVDFAIVFFVLIGLMVFFHV